MTPIELRVDNVLTSSNTDNAALPKHTRQLNDWPEELPEVDEPVTWVVMDSGIHKESVANHPWFENVEVVDRHDFTGAGTGGDSVGHGTFVASLIARHVPKVNLISVRIFGENGRTDFATIQDAYNWLINNSDKYDGVNMSWGARRDIAAINNLHKRLLNEGVYDVVAAGNTGGDGGSPATYKNTFAAGAVDKDGDPARFSSVDPGPQDNPDVAAIGVNVKGARAPGTSMGSIINDQFTVASGTSFSAPHTSAAYINALYDTRMSWDKRFEAAAPDIPDTEKDGEGLLKLNKALEMEGGGEEPNPTARVDIWEFFGNDTIYLHSDWLDSDMKKVEKMAESEDEVILKFS